MKSPLRNIAVLATVFWLSAFVLLYLGFAREISVLRSIAVADMTLAAGLTALVVRAWES